MNPDLVGRLRYEADNLRRDGVFINAADALAEAAAALSQERGVMVSPEMLRFLHGLGPLDGVHFGEPHPTERGNFWWRKHLPPAPTEGT